jgi:two-component system, NarL family, invasion response regulator UvrY
MTSVLIVDDHPIVLQGCRRVLQDRGMAPIFEARDMETGQHLARQHQPDVIIVDLAMQGGGLGGLSLIRAIRTNNPRARILVFSMHSDPIIVSHALQTGATGYLLKDTSSEDLVRAVETVAAGAPYLSPDLAAQVSLLDAGTARNPLADLTRRELQTLELLAQGKPYGHIATELNISYKTVVNVCYQLRQKLDVHTLPELIRLSVQLLPSAM